MSEYEFFVFRRSIDKIISFGAHDSFNSFLDIVVKKRKWSAESYDYIAQGRDQVIFFGIQWDTDHSEHRISYRVMYPVPVLNSFIEGLPIS